MKKTTVQSHNIVCAAVREIVAQAVSASQGVKATAAMVKFEVSTFSVGMGCSESNETRFNGAVVTVPGVKSAGGLIESTPSCEITIDEAEVKDILAAYVTRATGTPAKADDVDFVLRERAMTDHGYSEPRLERVRIEVGAAA